MDDYNDFFMKTMELLLRKDKKTISSNGLKQLKNIKFTEDMKEETCPISLEKFKEGEEITGLPCNHKYKEKYILKWLKEEKNCCPVCRYELCGETDQIGNILGLEKETILNITNVKALID